MMKKFFFIKNIFKLITILLFIVFFITPGKVKLQAQSELIVERNINKQYFFYQEFIKVIENINISVKKPNWRIGSNSLETLQIVLINNNLNDDILEKIKKSIKLTTKNTKIQSIREEKSESKILVDIEILTDIVFGKPLQITVEYDNYTLLNSYGLIYDIYIPGYSKTYEFQSGNSAEYVTTEFIKPKSAPDINFVSIDYKSKEYKDNIILQFDTEAMKGITPRIQLGNKQQYIFKFEQKIPRSSTAPIGVNIVKMMIPGDKIYKNFQQKTFYRYIKPEPLYVEKDRENNLIGVFKTRSYEDTTITLEGVFVSEITKTGVEDIKFLDKSRYLESAKYWESDHEEIVLFANTIKQKSALNKQNLINTLYNEIVERIDYSEVKKYGINKRQGALATLRGSGAVCMEYSDLLIATSRALGIPAKAVFGYGYDGFKNSVEPHQWAEIFYDNHWNSVDTTWGESGRQVIGPELNHIFLYTASKSPDDPPRLTLTSLIQNNNLPDIKFEIKAYKDDINLKTLQNIDEILKKYSKNNELENNYLISLIEDFIQYINEVTSAFFSQFGIKFQNFVEIAIIFIIVLFILIKLKNRKNVKIFNKKY